MSKKLTNDDLIQASTLLNIPVATIRAVIEVESRGSGFLPTGEPVILFEPHIFWRELVERKIDPNKYIKGNQDILYPKWISGKYGAYSAQHGRLQSAIAINRDAALSSASWGLFQVMGFNYQQCGCSTLQEFINRNYVSEGSQLLLFCQFVLMNKLDTYLRKQDWAGFASRYNGSGYKVNKYDLKLKQAFNKYNM